VVRDEFFEFGEAFADELGVVSPRENTFDEALEPRVSVGAPPTEEESLERWRL